MKKYFSCFVLTFLFINTWSQQSDLRINDLFVLQDFFKLKQEYSQSSKTSSEEMRLFSAAYIDSYFNKPAQANEAIQLLLEKHSDWLGAENCLSLAILMADNYTKEQNYKLAASIYEQLIPQLELYFEDMILLGYKQAFELYKSLENVEPIVVSYDKKKAVIPLKNDNAGLLTLPVKSTKSETLDFVLDFGAGHSMIEEQYAKDFDIEILADSILVVNATGVNVYSKIGIVKEIQIGEMTIKNVVFFVAPKILPEAISDSLNYEIKGIIGLPVLRSLEHFLIKKSEKIIVSKSKEKPKLSSNMMLQNYNLYVQAKTNNYSLLMIFDSGSLESTLTHRYLDKEKENMDNLWLDTLSLGSYGGIREFSVYKMKEFQCKIGHKTVSIPDISIFREEVIDFGLPVDGIIGRDMLNQNKKTVIDFGNMYMDFR